MKERLRIALVISTLIIGNIGFGAYLQMNPTLCDSISYPICTGSPD